MPAYIQNTDLLFLGITVAAIGILGYVVLISNTKSETNRTFFFMSGIAIFYAVFNYLSYHLTTTPHIVLWLLRFVLFLSVWYSFFLFKLLYVFPHEQESFPLVYHYALFPLIIFTSILTLTPFVFSRIIQPVIIGEVANPERGFGIIIFGVIITSLVISGVYLLIRKTAVARGLERKQLRLVLAGTFITYSLLIIFNFVLPVIFHDLTFIPFAPLFTFPFIAFTAYAVMRYRFLQIKVIATEILTFVLATVTILEVVSAENIYILLFRVIIFVLVLTFGIFLIRSVRKEVEQREELQKLASELAGANEELKKLDQAKSEFISIASHQLRAPLTVIKGYTSLILEGSMGKITKFARDALQKTAISTEQLVKLVADLLDLSRIESGKIQYEFVPVDFPKLVENVVDEFKYLAEKREIVLNFKNNAAELPPLTLDSDKIREVVINLVDNAVKYTKDKSSIEIIISEPRKGWVRLAVQDQGIGIRSTDIKKLFIKFNRTDEARVIDQNGMGIGLYFVKRIVEDHGGKVQGESEGLNKGSTFSIDLPIK